MEHSDYSEAEALAWLCEKIGIKVPHGDDVIAQLNKEFAVADVGGKVVILHKKKAQFDLKNKRCIQNLAWK